MWISVGAGETVALIGANRAGKPSILCAITNLRLIREGEVHHDGQRSAGSNPPKLVQDIARSIVAINRDEKVSVLLVEQNSRMALRISQRAYALTTGSVALHGPSPDLLRDDRVKSLYLGGEL